MRLTDALITNEKYRGEPFTDDAGSTHWPPHVIWDDELEGFGVRIYPPVRGRPPRKVFIVTWKVALKTRTMAIGTYGKDCTLRQARRTARQAIELARRGRDPIEERQVALGIGTAEDLASRFLFEHKAAQKRGADEAEAIAGGRESGLEGPQSTAAAPASGAPTQTEAVGAAPDAGGGAASSAGPPPPPEPPPPLDPSAARLEAFVAQALEKEEPAVRAPGGDEAPAAPGAMTDATVTSSGPAAGAAAPPNDEPAADAPLGAASLPAPAAATPPAPAAPAPARSEASPASAAQGGASPQSSAPPGSPPGAAGAAAIGGPAGPVVSPAPPGAPGGAPEAPIARQQRGPTKMRLWSVPDALYRELERRARSAGLTMSGYLQDLLERDPGLDTSVQDVFRQVGARQTLASAEEPAGATAEIADEQGVQRR